MANGAPVKKVSCLYSGKAQSTIPHDSSSKQIPANDILLRKFLLNRALTSSSSPTSESNTNNHIDTAHPEVNENKDLSNKLLIMPT